MMIQISKDSWHYKMASLMRDYWWERPTSLCPYFWAVVRGVLLSSLAVVIGVVVLASYVDLAYCIYMYFATGVKDVSFLYWGTRGTEDYFPLFIISMGVSIVATLIAALFFLVYLEGKYKEYKEEQWRKAIQGAGSSKKDPNPIYLYFKAKKEKFCPSVTYVDTKVEEDENVPD